MNTTRKPLYQRSAYYLGHNSTKISKVEIDLHPGQSIQIGNTNFVANKVLPNACDDGVIIVVQANFLEDSLADNARVVLQQSFEIPIPNQQSSIIKSNSVTLPESLIIFKPRSKSMLWTYRSKSFRKRYFCLELGDFNLANGNTLVKVVTLNTTD